MERFALTIGKVEYTNAEWNYRVIYNDFVELGLKAYDEFVPQAEEIFKKDKNEVGLASVEAIAKKLVNNCVQGRMLETLIANKIYTYDFERIKSTYGIYNTWQASYNELCKEWQFYKEKNEKAHAEREEIKANRGRWRGGGFGVKGALKGAATAGVLNGVSGMLYSVGNAIGNAHSDSIMEKEMEALFSERTLPESLGQQLFTNIVRLADILGYILNENGIPTKIYSQEETCKCNNILKNYSKIKEKEEKKSALLQCFKLYPYEEKIYQLYINDFYMGHTQESEFERMSNFFGQNLEELRETVICETLEEIYYEADEAERIRLIQLYQKQKEVFGLFERQDLSELESEYIDVRDIVVSVEKSKLMSLYQIEGSVSKKRLEDGDILVCGDCDKAISYLKQQKKIREIYDKCDFTDRNSILEALKKIQTEASKSEYQNMGKDLVAYLQICAELQNGVFDFYVEHKSLENNVQEWQHGKFVIEKNIEKLDEVEWQEYLTKTYYCANQEEKENVRKNIIDIKQRYENTDFKDESAISELLSAVQKIHRETQLGGALIYELEERLKYCDKCARTVLDIEYATRQEAEKEREKVAGARKYESIEDAQMAKAELQKIEDAFKEAQRNGLISSLHCYKSLSKEKFVTPSARDGLNEVEKELASEYRKLCRDVEAYEKAKRGMALWIPISVIATVILLGIFLSSGFVGKVICFFIDCYFWGTVIENKEVIDSHSKDIVKEKAEIDRMALIQNNTVCFIDTKYLGEKCPKCGYVMQTGMSFCPMCGEEK